MEEKLKAYLLDLGLSENEIEDMQIVAPLLNTISYEKAQSIINILKFYNIDDFLELFYANPNILTSSPKRLASIVSNLLSRGVDVEEYLKQNIV